MTSRRRFVLTCANGIFLRGASRAEASAAEGLLTPYKLGSLVLAASGQKRDFDAISVDCPFVFQHEGKFYMTYVAFDGTGYQTGLASSDDLVHWHKDGCILRRDPASAITRYNIAMNWILRENNLHSAGKLIRVDGEFLGAYHAYPNQGLEQGAAIIGLCRSKDLRHWKIGEPVLEPASGADWERGGLYKPCLLKDGNTYYLFYNAKNQTEGSWHEQTGVAFSTDLRTWKRYEGNPIIRNGAPGSPDSKFASDPCVLRAALSKNAEWALYYFGLDDSGKARDLVATAPDLFHFTKLKEIVVDVGRPGSVDSAYAHKPSVVTWRGDLYHFYCAVSRKGNEEIRGISVARSRPWA